MHVVWLTIGWLAGIVVAAGGGVNWPFWLAGSGACLVLVPVFRYQPRARLSTALGAAFCLGAARVVLAQPATGPEHVSFYNGAEATLTGLVTAEPELRKTSQRLTLTAEAITVAGGATRPVTGKVLVTTPRFPAIAYGTRLRLSGELEEPPVFETFNYRDYLARRGVHSLMRRPALVVSAEGAGHAWRAALLRFKGRAQTSIKRLVPEPEAALLSGILLGNDSGLPDDLQVAFRATGMSHIIAISGFNISLLAGGLTRLTTPLVGRRRSAWIALAGIGLYTVLVGADAAVVRAAVMGSLYLTGNRLLGRPMYALGSLFAAAFLMTAANPLSLWDVGFQLSFAATLGLMLYAERFNRWTEGKLTARLPVRFVRPLMAFLSDSVLVTLAAQLATLPLMLAVFDQVSLVSLVANPLILPAQPGIMTLGGLATGLGMVAPSAAQPIAWLAWLLLDYTTSMVALLGSIPWAAVPVSLGTFGALALYMLLGGLTWFLFQPLEERQELAGRVGAQVPAASLLGCSLAAAALALGWGRSQPDGLLRVTFLDLDQEEALFIQTASGRQIMVSNRLHPPTLAGTLGCLLPYWDRSLDLLVLTDSPDDPAVGLAEGLNRYRLGRLIVGGGEPREGTGQDSLPTAAEHSLTVHHAADGEVIVVDEGARLEILHPLPQHGGQRDGPIVLRLAYEGFTLLLVGHADRAFQQAMLDLGRAKPATVIQISESAGEDSMAAAFLQAVQPQIVVASDQENLTDDGTIEILLPAAEVRAPLLRTAELGSIEVVTDGRLMWWTAEGRLSSGCP